MSLKLSCFKTTVKCDLKRAWWISALAVLFFTMISTASLISYGLSRELIFDNLAQYVNSQIGYYIFGMFLSVFSVIYLFTYMNKVNSVSFFHALPMTRCTLFFSHLTSCVIVVIIPMLANMFMSFLTMSFGVKPSWIFVSLGLYAIYSILMMAITLTIVMLTGVSLTSGIFTIIAVFLPLFLSYFVYVLCGHYLYGFADNDVLSQFMANYVYLFPENILSAKMLIYIVLIIGFTALSLFLYKKRHLENYGEVIAFPNLKVVFKVLFALCSGILGYYYFSLFWNVDNILTMLVFGIIGAIASNMITNKCITFKGVLKPILITGGITIVLYLAFAIDIFGFENRIPTVDEISYVELGDIYYDDEQYYYNNERQIYDIEVTRKNKRHLEFKSKEEIESFLKIHKFAVDNKHEFSKLTGEWKYDDRYVSSFKIKYTLKNGRVMTRTYYLYDDDIEKYTEAIYDTDTYRKWKYLEFDDEDVTCNTITVKDIRTYYDNEQVEIPAQSEKAKLIFDALRKDLMNISYKRIDADEDTLMKISLDYSVPYVDDYGNEYPIKDTSDYYISKYDKYTWALLEELDLFSEKRMIDYSDINEINVHAIDITSGSDSSYYQDIYDDRVFTEQEQIMEIFDLYTTHHNDFETKEKLAKIRIKLELISDADEDTSDTYEYRSRDVSIPIKDLPQVLSYIESIPKK